MTRSHGAVSPPPRSISSGRNGSWPAVDDDLRKLASGLALAKVWMILTEAWCADSVQGIPYLVRIAEVSPLITVRLLHRDQNREGTFI